MDELPKELIVGIISSSAGALVVYLAQSGIQLTRKARQRARKVRRSEADAWKSNKPEIQQSITNQYLFSILRYLFLGNLLWLVTQVIAEPMRMLDVTYELYSRVTYAARIGALLCFFIGLGRILRYLRLRSSG